MDAHVADQGPVPVKVQLYQEPPVAPWAFTPPTFGATGEPVVRMLNVIASMFVGVAPSV